MKPVTHDPCSTGDRCAKKGNEQGRREKKAAKKKGWEKAGRSETSPTFKGQHRSSKLYFLWAPNVFGEKTEEKGKSQGKLTEAAFRFPQVKSEGDKNSKEYGGGHTTRGDGGGIRFKQRKNAGRQGIG